MTNLAMKFMMSLLLLALFMEIIHATEINQTLLEKEKLTDKQRFESIQQNLDNVQQILKKQSKKEKEKALIFKIECCTKVFQLGLDAANCILPGFIFFDKAVILVWVGTMSRMCVRPLPAFLKLISSSILMIANSVLVHKSLEEFQNLVAELGEGGEGGEMFGENSAFELSLFPNSDGARAVIIVLPSIYFFVLECMNCSPQPETGEKEGPCSKLIRASELIANMFLPAFLPPQLFAPLFSLTALQTFFSGAEEAVLVLNIWAITQYKTEEMVPGQLVASVILLVIFFLISCFKCKQ